MRTNQTKIKLKLYSIHTNYSNDFFFLLGIPIFYLINQFKYLKKYLISCLIIHRLIMYDVRHIILNVLF